MGGSSISKEKRKEALKELIRQLHKGANPEEMKAKFQEELGDVTPVEIARAEEELIREGLPREEIQRLCDVHLAVFRESLEQAGAIAPPGHPIHILMEEHRILLEFSEKLYSLAKELQGARGFDSVSEQMGQISGFVKQFKDSEGHYLREENVLFPYLEKHGVTQPPAIMWMEHDQIRTIKKNFYELYETRERIGFPDFSAQLTEIACSLAEMLASHFTKENNILFPTALKVILNEEWSGIRQEFDYLGYCSFTPQPALAPLEVIDVQTPSTEISGFIPFATGTLAKEELEAMLNTLPVDVTFVDKEGTVRYFSQSKERIFVRTKAVIGRSVQKCHPQKSIHVVTQILTDFKEGKRDIAEFWINLKGRLIFIRYFAIHDKSGEYLGCLEVTQDITDIQKITGEKRLL